MQNYSEKIGWANYRGNLFLCGVKIMGLRLEKTFLF
jgi:hypothetical protein